MFWVVDLIENKVEKTCNLHTGKINFVAFTNDGKFCLTRSPEESIIWDTKTWKDIIIIEEDFGIVTSTNRCASAFIHDGLYKPWSMKIIKDFSDDFNFEEEEGTNKEKKSSIVKDEDIRFRGPMN